MPFMRRTFLKSLSGGSLAVTLGSWPVASSTAGAAEPSTSAAAGEGLVQYIARTRGQWDAAFYKQLLGAANEFKEGDQIIGVAATDDAHRMLARRLLSATRLSDIDAHPLQQDDLFSALQNSVDAKVQSQIADWTFGQLKNYLLQRDEAAIKAIMPGLSSDVIGCVVKLMSNDELTAVGQKVFNPLPGSNIGAKGFLGARIQPNSPTDNVDDIRWQVLNGWSYAVGDVVLGNNPVSSDPDSVAAIEGTLLDLLQTFELTDVLPHCVLSHIDVQAEVEEREPGSTALWFQSIAGSDAANATFDLTLQKLLDYAALRTAPFGLYFETGQGADFTNGHGQGYDMVLHESRKYGLCRLMSQKVAAARGQAEQAWVHVNDVAGFIGPEVFRTRQQLVRCCLEDIVMGKLHGLCIGLDVCSTLHMDVSLDDLDWCLDQLAPAQPAYLMALPTKIDPMLGYLTTGFQDHVRLREKFGTRVNDAMWQFFKQLEVIDEAGEPTKHFGDPLWVYLQYRRRKGDDRTDRAIFDEGRAQMAATRERGVFLATGHGEKPSDLDPQLTQEIRHIYDDAKQSIWAEFDQAFRASQAGALQVATCSANREDYILHPASGEKLSESSLAALKLFREQAAGKFDVQMVVSDGLNALSIMDQTQLKPFLHRLRENLSQNGYRVAPQSIVVRAGRVRAGYQIGEHLFGGLPGRRALLHVIGERPGSGHRTFSIYMTCPDGKVWGTPGKVDHQFTRVVAGIANTALVPTQAADDAARILQQMWNQP
jgi:ethanolamine ammonia-lyase large subunit